MKNVLVQLIRTGKSIRQMYVKAVVVPWYLYMWFVEIANMRNKLSEMITSASFFFFFFSSKQTTTPTTVTHYSTTTTTTTTVSNIIMTITTIIITTIYSELFFLQWYNNKIEALTLFYVIADLLYRSSIRQEDYVTELEILDACSRAVICNVFVVNRSLRIRLEVNFWTVFSHYFEIVRAIIIY